MRVLIDGLLERSNDYAAHWTPFFEEAIASSPFETQGSVRLHGNYQAWILESFRTNRPYDQMVAQLIDPTEPGYVKKNPINVNGKEAQIAVARYAMNPDGESCEFALVVADDWHRKGIGARLVTLVGKAGTEKDLTVNVCKAKQLTNMRAAGSDEAPDLPPPEAVTWLLRLAELLEASPAPPAAWLTANDLPKIAEDLELCADDYQRRGQTRAPLTERYGPGIWKLAEGTAA